ncbi:cytochrome c [Granulosicoccaceae sp. 1_MG-2023]|nr:cytochrome c [Granulosicoccaceae sp. 1_MG-2023]
MLLSGCGGEVEDTLPGQPIKHRREAFKEILRTFEPMGVMLRENTYSSDEFNQLAAALMEIRDTPWAYFTDDSNQPPSKAKDALWANRADFDAHRLAFMDSTDALFEAAKTENPETIHTAYDKVGETCKSCHKLYRR